MFKHTNTLIYKKHANIKLHKTDAQTHKGTRKQPITFKTQADKQTKNTNTKLHFNIYPLLLNTYIQMHKRVCQTNIKVT